MGKSKKSQEDNKDSEDISLKRLEFEYALTLRNFEIDLFWKRVWFFGALLLGISAAYFELRKSTEPIIPVVCLSFIGSIIAISQSLMSRGSKYWQERWEYITKNRESALGIELTKNRMFKKQHESFYIHASILEKEESILTRAHRVSVSKLTFFVWDLISISFIFIWLKDVIAIVSFEKANTELTIQLSIYYIVIIFYSILFWKKGKVISSETIIKNKKENSINYKSESENHIANKISEL